MEDPFWQSQSRRMVEQCNQGFASSDSRSTNNRPNRRSLYSSLRKITRISTNFRSYPRFLPNRLNFAFLPTAGIIPEVFKEPNGVIGELLFNPHTREKVAEKITPSFSLSDWLGLKPKIEEIATQMHQQSLLTPDPNDDNIDFVKYLYDYAGAAPVTHFMPDWFKELMILLMATVNQYSHDAVQFMLKQTYKLVTNIVLFTPEWIFENSWFPTSVQKFTGISILIVVCVTMFEGIKRMCRFSATPFIETLKKLPIALGVSSLAPFLFMNGLRLLNRATKLILKIASDEIGNSEAHTVFASSVMIEPLNIITMIAFCGIVCWFLFPMIIFNGKRWFDFVANAMVTPLAMSAYLFQSTERFFHMWLRNIKSLSYTQLIYAAYIALLGTIMFATPNPTNFSGVLAKTLIMIGGLYNLAYPPSFVKQFDNSKVGVKEVIGEFKKQKGNYGKAKTTTEDSLIGSARIAGKAYRIVFKNRGDKQ